MAGSCISLIRGEREREREIVFERKREIERKKMNPSQSKPEWKDCNFEKGEGGEPNKLII